MLRALVTSSSPTVTVVAAERLPLPSLKLLLSSVPSTVNVEPPCAHAAASIVIPDDVSVRSPVTVTSEDFSISKALSLVRSPPTVRPLPLTTPSEPRLSSEPVERLASFNPIWPAFVRLPSRADTGPLPLFRTIFACGPSKKYSAIAVVPVPPEFDACAVIGLAPWFGSVTFADHAPLALAVVVISSVDPS